MKDYPCFDKYFNSIEIFLSQGKQPRVTVPPFFPDNVKPFMSQADAEALKHLDGRHPNPALYPNLFGWWSMCGRFKPER